MRSLLIDSQRPNVVFLGTSSGKIFQSRDGGNSWTLLHPGIGNRDFVVDTLVQHPKEPDHIYAGCWDLHSDGGGLFESRDSGKSWKQIVLPQISSAVRALAICRKDPARMIVGTLAGAYLSSDGGQSWKKTGGSELQRAESVGIDPDDCRFLYVGTWRLGYRSTDFGKSWTRVARGMAFDSDIFSISINGRDPQVLYASACSGVYRSDDRALSWTRLRMLADRFTVRARVVRIDPLDAQKIYAGTTEGLFVSNDEGKTWRRLTKSDVVVNAIQIDPGDTRRILIGTEYQGILLSEDRGETWRESNTGFVHQQISWITPDPSIPGAFFAGVQSGSGGLSLYNPKDRAWSWAPLAPGARIWSFLILPQNRGKLAGTLQGVYWLPKGSARWTKLNGSIAKRSIYSLEFDPLSSVLYAGTDQGVYVTPLSTLQFRVPPDYRLSPRVWCLTASRTTSGLVYAGSSLGVLRSSDRGTTWQVISFHGLPERSIIETLSVSPENPQKLWAGTSAGLFVSKDGGIHWTRAAAGIMAGDIASVLFLDDSGLRIAAGDKNSGGIFYSKDGGESWVKFFSPEYQSPAYCLSRVDRQPSEVLVGTRSEGIYRIRIGARQSLPR